MKGKALEHEVSPAWGGAGDEDEDGKGHAAGNGWDFSGEHTSVGGAAGCSLALGLRR